MNEYYTSEMYTLVKLWVAFVFFYFEVNILTQKVHLHALKKRDEEEEERKEKEEKQANKNTG